MMWTNEITLNFIEDYHNSSELLDIKIADYKNNKIKNDSLEELSGEYLQSLMFGFHKYFIGLMTPENFENLSPSEIARISMIAGGISASLTLSLTYQLFFCHSLITGYRGPLHRAKYSTIYGCLSNVYKKEGISGWYRGFYISQISVIINRTLFFGLYDVFKFSQNPTTSTTSGLTKLISAQAASILSAFAAYPSETVARRIILETGRSNKRYSSALHGFKVIYQNEGFKGFFGGGFINVVRSIGGTIVLIMHDELSSLMMEHMQ